MHGERPVFVALIRAQSEDPPVLRVDVALLARRIGMVDGDGRAFDELEGQGGIDAARRRVGLDRRGRERRRPVAGFAARGAEQFEFGSAAAKLYLRDALLGQQQQAGALPRTEPPGSSVVDGERAQQLARGAAQGAAGVVAQRQRSQGPILGPKPFIEPDVRHFQNPGRTGRVHDEGVARRERGAHCRGLGSGADIAAFDQHQRGVRGIAQARGELHDPGKGAGRRGRRAPDGRRIHRVRAQRCPGVAHHAGTGGEGIRFTVAISGRARPAAIGNDQSYCGRCGGGSACRLRHARHARKAKSVATLRGRKGP